VSEKTRKSALAEGGRKSTEEGEKRWNLCCLVKRGGGPHQKGKVTFLLPAGNGGKRKQTPLPIKKGERKGPPFCSSRRKKRKKFKGEKRGKGGYLGGKQTVGEGTLQ